MTATKTNPVLFIHGLRIHSSAWQPWLDLFTERGYDVSPPGWPGDGGTVAATRENADALGHSLTMDEGWRDVAEVALNWFAAKGF